MRQNHACILILVLCLLSGCVSQQALSINKVNQTAENIAELNHFEKQLITTNHFTLTSFQKFRATNIKGHSTHNNAITIYIEGDGRTWMTRSKLSDNPTPKNPLALKLAVLDKSPHVAYLARPCQYTPLDLEMACTPLIWSDQRYSTAVIESMNHAVEKLKNTAKANKIHLVGFSGGGAVALLIAANRQDIASIRTVAGDLNPNALSQYHHTSPLTGSLDPMMAAKQLIHIPQQHFSGEKDTTVPPFIAEGYINFLTHTGSHCAEKIVLKNATHHEAWEANWPMLLEKPFLCLKNKV